MEGPLTKSALSPPKVDGSATKARPSVRLEAAPAKGAEDAEGIPAKSVAESAVPAVSSPSKAIARGQAGHGSRLARGTTGYFPEKLAVVIDFGRVYTKVGFATESRPRHFIRTPQLDVQRSTPTFDCSITRSEWVDILDKLLNQVFFHYLSVSPKDRRVVICDSIFSATQFRVALAYVLFKRFCVPSVVFIADLALPLYLTGLNSGLVIDAGYASTRVMATFAGIPIISAFSSTAAAGRRVNASLIWRLPDTLGERVVDDIKAQVCYVALDASLSGGGGAGRATLKTDKPAQADGGLAVPPESRWTPAELLFRPDPENGPEGGWPEGDVADACESIPAAVLRTLERCPVDIRGAVLQNIVVCGGTAMLRGFLPRLAVELRDALQRRPATAALAERLRFTLLDFAPVCAVWAGGSVLGALEGLNDYTADDYSSGRPLPDWAKDGFV